MRTPVPAPTAHPRSAEDGVAMVAVLTALVLVSVLVLGSLAHLSASVRLSRVEQDRTAAEAAARSGVSDFLSRMRIDPDYLDNADPASLDAGNYCHNPAVAGPDVTLPAAGSPATPVCANLTHVTPYGWVAVEHGRAASPETPSFHYRVVRHDTAQREILLESVGRARDEFRTLQARIALPSSADYVYFSDYELADPHDPIFYPENVVYPGTQTTSAACGGLGPESDQLSYAWDPTPPAPRTYFIHGDRGNVEQPCLVRAFSATDVLTGKVHSNDTILAKAGVTLGYLSTSHPGCASADPSDGATWSRCVDIPASASLKLLGPPTYVPEPLAMPSVVKVDELSETVGCRYAGVTRIVVKGPTMTVWSKGTKESRPACGQPGTGPGQLGSKDGATVALPAEGLVYVDDATGVSGTLISGGLGGPAGRELPLGTYTGQKPKPGATYLWDITFDASLKYASLGNLLVEGIVDGQVTFAAAKSVVITGDVLLQGGRQGDDVVGIVAGTSIEVFRPFVARFDAQNCEHTCVWSDNMDPKLVEGWPSRYADPSTGVVSPAKGVQVAAAMLALNGSLRLQEWRSGWKPNPTYRGEVLNVFGSIAQRFHGETAGRDSQGRPVTGYTKVFEYDPRLANGLRPPHFPVLANGEWTVTSIGEQPTNAASQP
ncbi:hypothetical protein [Xylanimonas ulmi]|uniref:Uncharacterized protein n=1 Tax=Xylanimonas ulmi TaxID=228973 RepID=A0A4Q7M151_9MICO|nr:hypothetical protein [Xylanibacterium ulmi]RZS61525.1 hypothetical protein EV386_1829 [Xylanibacterium ulmi]